MLLKDWRNQQGWPLTKMAREVSAILGRELHYRTVQRYETGENQTPTDVTEALRLLTKGAVGPEDVHKARVKFMNEVGMLDPVPEEVPEQE